MDPALLIAREHRIAEAAAHAAGDGVALERQRRRPVEAVAGAVELDAVMTTARIDEQDVVADRLESSRKRGIEAGRRAVGGRCGAGVAAGLAGAGTEGEGGDRREREPGRHGARVGAVHVRLLRVNRGHSAPGALTGTKPDRRQYARHDEERPGTF